MSSASLEVLQELPSLSARLRRGQEDRMPGQLPAGPRQGVARPAQLLPPLDLRPLLPNEEPMAENVAQFDLRAGASLVVLARVCAFNKLLRFASLTFLLTLSSSRGFLYCMVDLLISTSIFSQMLYLGNCFLHSSSHLMLINIIVFSV